MIDVAMHVSKVMKVVFLLAGLSPPPPLFIKYPTARTVTPTAALPEPSSTASSDSGSSSSDEEGGEEEEGNSSKVQHWVQCEHSSCRKWRPLSKDTKIDVERYTVEPPIGVSHFVLCRNLSEITFGDTTFLFQL